MKNHYATLSVSPSATAEQIKTAYTNAVLKIQAQPNFAARFAEIQQAYDILSNPAKRKELDAELLNFYTGKFTNINNPAQEQQPKRKTPPPIPQTQPASSTVADMVSKSKNVIEAITKSEEFKTISKVSAYAFSITAALYVFIFLLNKCNNNTPAKSPETSQISHDIGTGEFTPSNSGNSNNIEPEVAKPSYVDPILQDSINLINAGYEIRQLKNGAEPDCFNYTPRKSSIDNKLEVYVGYGSDVAVKLIDKETENCIRYFYVNSGSTYTIRGIPQGIYYLKLAYGKQRQLLHNPHFG